MYMIKSLTGKFKIIFLILLLSLLNVLLSNFSIDHRLIYTYTFNGLKTNSVVETLGS